MSRSKERDSAMTWRQLKEKIATLDERQLDMKVMWAGEERGGFVQAVDVLDEDHINPSGDAWEPKSVYLDPLRKSLEACEEEDVAKRIREEIEEYEGEEIVGAKGQAILTVDL
jgi:hypothetical protein